MDLKDHPITDNNKWRNINKTLDEKYLVYKKTTSEKAFGYMDENTSLAVYYDDNGGCLGYTDILLQEKISQKEKDEF